MTDVITFSRPYAEAAYKVAVNDNTIDIWLQDMNILGKAVKESRVKALLASPKIKKLDKIGFLTSLTNNKNELAEAIDPITAIVLSPLKGLCQLIFVKLKINRRIERNIKIESAILILKAVSYTHLTLPTKA